MNYNIARYICIYNDSDILLFSLVGGSRTQEERAAPPWANARSPAAPARSLDVLHHLLELLEVDLTVAVLVDLADRGLELLLRVDVFEILAAEELPDFLAVDFA